MPNRIVRVGFLDSEAVHSLTDAAECFYHRLLLAADDAGRIDGRLEILRARLFPLDSSRRVSDVEKSLHECVKVGLVLGYQVSGKPYLQVMRWQRCGNATTSKYPDAKGSHTIEYVKRETADGLKDFVSSSLSHSDPILIPSVRDEKRLEYEDGDGNEDDKQQSRKSAPVVLIPENLNNQDFADAWQRWLKHRSEIRKPLKETGQNTLLKQLAAMGKDAAIKAIDTAIANGWQGCVFESNKAKPDKSKEIAARNERMRIQEARQHLREVGIDPDNIPT